jgi:Fe-S cluster assembly ATP-binding protein
MLQLKDLYFTVSEPDENGTVRTRNIIDGLSYTFEPGKMYAITGPNGSGKTTTAKLIMGIEKPTSGRIFLSGEDITELGLTERAAKGIAYGFQTPARFKGITFRDLLSIAAGTDDEKALVTLISRVGICSLDFLDKQVDGKLSGGEIKKIELATIIARAPRLAIYDEPDTGIDLWTIGPMVDLIKSEQQANNSTTIIVSHNKSFLQEADQVVLIRNGKLAFTGDFKKALPLLSDLSLCEFRPACEDGTDVRCVR